MNTMRGAYSHFSSSDFNVNATGRGEIHKCTNNVDDKKENIACHEQLLGISTSPNERECWL